MEFFRKARTVRLRGHHGKYLWADDDQFKVSQNRERLAEQALWRVEAVPDSNLIRLISCCYDTYLTASDDLFLLGMTGKKVVQTKKKLIDSSVEWEAVSEGFLVKLKTCHGNFLRANNGLPPWRNTVTHDLPSKILKHQEFLLWEVENVSVPNIVSVEPLLEFVDLNHHQHAYTDVWTALSKAEPVPPPLPPRREAHHAWISYSPSSTPRPSHPKPDEGRDIFFTVANERGEAKNVEDDGWALLKFKGQSLKLLEKRLQEETGINEDIVLCARHPMSTKLYTLRLGLPPNNAAMHIVVLKATSSCKHRNLLGTESKL